MNPRLLRPIATLFRAPGAIDIRDLLAFENLCRDNDRFALSAVRLCFGESAQSTNNKPTARSKPQRRVSMNETNEEQTASVPAIRGLTLAQLVQYEQELMAKLYDANGEVTEEIQDMLAISEKTLPEKVDAYAHMIERLAIEAGRIGVIIDDYERMMQQLTKAREWMKENMKAAMKSLDRVELCGIDKKFRLMNAQPKLEILNDHIAGDLLKEDVRFVVDKEKVKDALEAGVAVPGARFVESDYVRVFANAPERVSAAKKPSTRKKGATKEDLQ